MMTNRELELERSGDVLRGQDRFKQSGHDHLENQSSLLDRFLGNESVCFSVAMEVHSMISMGSQ